MIGDSNTYPLQRVYYGLPIKFKNREDTDLKLLAFKPDNTLAKQFKYRNPKTITLSNIPEKSRHVVHTQKTQTKTVLIKHVEGGWPKTIEDVSDTKETHNWKRHRENHEEKETFATKVKILIANTTGIVNQNLRMDVYENYFDSEEANFNDDDFSAKIKTVFKDTEPYRRTVNRIAWSTDEDQSKIAVTYKLSKGQTLPTGYKLPCLVWDVKNPNNPCNVLTYSSEILVASFNRNPNYLGCGCANGTVIVFDLTTNKIIASSKLEDSHSEAITDFVWLKTRLGTEFVTTSTDGKAIWWDMKNMPVIECEKPVRLIDPADTENQKLHCGLKIEYNPEAGQNKFLISTEQGVAFLANKRKNEADIVFKFSNKLGKHLGPIAGIQRCPANTKFFATVGDWTLRIWADDYPRSPLIVSKYNPALLTDCLWSNARQGLLFVSRSDGWIMAYDICYKVNEPAFSYKVCNSNINSIALNLKGNRLIVGDEDGKVHLIKLSESFYSQYDIENKKDFISKFLERENARERALDVKKKPLKDDLNKTNKQEQFIKEKINKIEQEYYPYLSKVFGGAFNSEKTNTLAQEKKMNPEENVKKLQESALNVSKQSEKQIQNLKNQQQSAANLSKLSEKQSEILNKKQSEPYIEDQNASRISGKAIEDPSSSRISAKVREDPNHNKIDAGKEDPNISKNSNKGKEDVNMSKISSKAKDDPNLSKLSGKAKEDPNLSKISSKAKEDPNLSKISGRGREDPNLSKLSERIKEEANLSHISDKHLNDFNESKEENENNHMEDNHDYQIEENHEHQNEENMNDQEEENNNSQEVKNQEES